MYTQSSKDRLKFQILQPRLNPVVTIELVVKIKLFQRRNEAFYLSISIYLLSIGGFVHTISSQHVLVHQLGSTTLPIIVPNISPVCPEYTLQLSKWLPHKVPKVGVEETSGSHSYDVV